MALEAVQNCCRRIISEKVTERKKGADQLKSLLNNNAIVLKLCQNSQERRHLTWDQVFRSSEQFLLKESEKLERDERSKENPSATVLSNWTNAKRSAAFLPKLVLKNSCKGSPHVSVNVLMEYVFTILNRDKPYLLENFAGNAIQIAHQYLLFYPQYYVHISQEKLKNLSRISMWILDNNLKNVDAISVINVIEDITKLFCGSYNSANRTLSPSSVLRPLPGFICRTLKNSSFDKQFALKHALLSLLHTTCLQFGSQWRFLLCKVGEETFESVLSLWENSSSQKQIRLLQYLNLQLILHHPQQDGIHHKECAFAFHKEEWERRLRQLYLIISDCISEVAQIMRVTPSSKDIISDEFITLAARVCSQIFSNYEEATSLEVTQLGATQMPTQASLTTQRSTKRRKVEIGFVAFCERINDEGLLEMFIPWYKILSKMLQDHREFFASFQRAKVLLDVFLQLLKQCKNSLVVEEIIRCLKALAHPRFFAPTNENFEQDKRKWTQVAEITSRLVAGKLCVTVGMQMLEVLISNHLTMSQASLYRLFLKGIFIFNESGLRLLETMLINYPLPKVIKTEDYLCMEDLADPRITLVKMILPIKEGGNGDMNSVLAVNYPSLCANVLGLLRLQNSSKVQPQADLTFAEEKKLTKEKVLEDLLLKTFSCYKKTSRYQDALDFSQDNLRILPDVQDALVNHLKDFTAQCACKSAANIGKEDVFVTFNTCLTIIYLWPLVSDGRLADLMPKLEPVFEYTKKLLSLTSDSNCSWDEIVCIFQRLKFVFATAFNLQQIKDVNLLYLESLLSDIPKNFEDAVVRVIKSRQPYSSTGGRAHDTTQVNQSRTRNLDPDLDSSYEDSDNEVTYHWEDEFNEETEAHCSQIETNTKRFSCLSRSNLLTKDEAILSMMEWLGKLYEIERTKNPSNEETLPFETCLKTFNNLIDSERDEDKIMVFGVIHLLMIMKYDEDNVEDALKLLLRISNSNAKDWRVICFSLCTVKEFLHFNGSTLATVEDQRTNVVRLITQFSDKFFKGMNGLNIRELIFENVVHLNRIDPLRVWTSFSVNGDFEYSQPYSLIKNPYHHMRMRAVEAVPLLFQTQGKQLPVQHQKRTFEEMYKTALESLNIEGNLNEDFAADEGCCRAASFLSCLAAVTTSSLVLESHALYAIVSSVKVNGIDVTVVKRVLRSISHRHPTLTSYLDCHFAYLVCQWVKDSHPLQTFPFLLFDCQDFEAFARSYGSRIVSALYPIKEGLSEIERMAHTVNVEIKTLLNDNFAFIMASILPYLIAIDKKEETGLAKVKLGMASRQWKHIMETFGDELHKAHVDNDVGLVILHLLRMNHDSKPWYEEEVVVSPSHLYFEAQIILYTLKNYHSVFRKGDTTLVRLLCDRKSPMQSILHGLFTDVAKAMTLQSTWLRWSLASFETFVRFIMANMAHELGNMEYFLVKRVVHMLTNFIIQLAPSNAPFAGRCCELLHDFVFSCIMESTKPDVLVTTLPSIIPRLHSLHCNKKVWDGVYKILLLVFEAQNSELKIALSAIAPFPLSNNNKQLEHLRSLQQKLTSERGDDCLRKKVIKFIDVPSFEISSYDVNSVLCLLTEKITEIFELYLSAMQDGAGVAHSLIYKLVSLVSNSEDNQTKQLCLKCLGKLGPVDLNTSVFVIAPKVSSLFKNLTGDHPILAEILIALNRLTFSSNQLVVDSAIVALGHVCCLKDYYCTLKEAADQELIRDLLPFLPSRVPKTMERQYEDCSLSECEKRIGNESLYDVGSDFSSWLRIFTVNLIEMGCGSDLFYHLIPVCQLDSSFCQLVLPYVFLHTLKADRHRRGLMSKMVMKLVANLSSLLALGEQTHNDKKRIHAMKSCLRILISVINYLRTKDSGICSNERKITTNWDRNLWLDLDFLKFTKAALICGSFFSAVLFAEIACDIIQDNMKVSVQDRQLPPLQRIATLLEGKEISALLLQAYNALGSSEGVEGCWGGSTVTDYVTQSTLSLHRGRSIEALCISDVGNARQCLMSGLQNSGMYNVLFKMTKAAQDKSNTQILEAQAECAWRLGKWDILESLEAGNDFNQSFFKSLAFLKDKDHPTIQETIDAFYRSTLSFLIESGHESTSSIYPILAHLQIFSELEEIAKCISFQTDDQFLTHLTSLDSLWNEKENFGQIKRVEKEKNLSARISTLKILTEFNEDWRRPVEDILFKFLMQKCEIGNLSERFSALVEAKHMKTKPEQLWTLKLEESKLALSLENISQTICTLESLIFDIEAEKSDSEERLREYYKAKALVLYGQVLQKSKTRSPKVIIKDYYEKAIKLIEENQGETRCEFLEECYYDLASFADELHQEVKLSLSSDESGIRMKQMEISENEIRRVNEVIKNPKYKEKNEVIAAELKALNKKVALLTRDVKRERNDFESRINEANDYLLLCLENYLKVLAFSSKYDFSIFRVVSLWLENLTNQRTNELVSEYSGRIKSHKFIRLLYQLAARLTCMQDSKKHHPQFPSVLSAILERVCREHPYHGLPVILTLANAHLDEQVADGLAVARGSRNKAKDRCRSAMRGSPVTEEDRVQAAKKLIEKLSSYSHLEEHIAELQNLTIAYMTLAIAKCIDQEEPTAPHLSKLRNFKYAAPLSRPVAVQPSGMYSAPLISSYDSNVTLVGGINAPLKLTLFSSDGVKSYELLKGNDDLRQDAVLQQVFTVVNELLKRDEEARKQSLSVRTYVVCPLSQNAGIIQWCNNTTTLGTYLEHAHKRYYPKDAKLERCKQKLKSSPRDRDASGRPVGLIQTMEEILSVVHPVFRFFFYEEYPEPDKWYSHRCSYTRSVATSSIAGYILGLGDRHVANLLLDTQTAEVIHIDFGIAFENGKLLPTPEKVPFRLTQDIVDGLGVMGVEGPLRKNMEITMRVLREAKSVLITIVEVLRHDPLHQWTLSPSQVAKLQQQQSQGIACNEGTTSASMAERALIRVRQKLNGLQDGLVLSVPEHVSVLIQQATDIANLAQMFCGWQPYL